VRQNGTEEERGTKTSLIIVRRETSEAETARKTDNRRWSCIDLGKEKEPKFFCLVVRTVGTTQKSGNSREGFNFDHLAKGRFVPRTLPEKKAKNTHPQQQKNNPKKKTTPPPTQKKKTPQTPAKKTKHTKTTHQKNNKKKKPQTKPHTPKKEDPPTGGKWKSSGMNLKASFLGNGKRPGREGAKLIEFLRRIVGSIGTEQIPPG